MKHILIIILFLCISFSTKASHINCDSTGVYKVWTFEFNDGDTYVGIADVYSNYAILAVYNLGGDKVYERIYNSSTLNSYIQKMCDYDIKMINKGVYNFKLPKWYLQYKNNIVKLIYSDR